MKKDDMYYQDFKDLADLFFCITENKILKERIEKAINKIQDLIFLGFDYDGFNKVDDLKKLIDELVNIAIDSIDILRDEEDL